MAKIAVIGLCGNSIFMQVDHFHRPGETLAAHSVFEEIGGKGINQAVAAARMGAEVSFLAAVGDDDTGKLCAQTAKDYGINGHFAVKSGKKTTFAFILTDKDGDNRVTVFRQAELTVEDVRCFEQEIADSDILLLQNEVPVEANDAAIALAKKHGVKVILNPAPARPIAPETVRGIFAVTPNEQERQDLDITLFENCITTLGKKGCSINDTITIPALQVQAVDTTGAGDTFNGTLAVFLAEGKTLEDACRLAVTAAGCSVMKPHVLEAIPTKKDLERMINHDEI